MRLRFTIRDLLWLTALVAMGIGWWLDRLRLASNFNFQLKQINKALELQGDIELHEVPEQ